MHPYIIILLLPLIGLLVFWFFPLSEAISFYVVILIVSGLLYWVIARAMKKRPRYAAQGLVGAEAKVVSKLGPRDEAQYMVRVHGELWRANSPDDLKPDETVKILSESDLTLLVVRAGTEPPVSQKIYK